MKQSKDEAARLIGQGRYNFSEIAEKAGVDVRTLNRWRKEDKFDAKVKELRAEMDKEALQRAIARKEYRVGVLADRHSKLSEVLEARAEVMGDIPGGRSGYLVRSIVASGGELIGYEYAVDTGALKELRAIEEQVAKELGQIVDKREVTGKDGGPLQLAVERMSDEQIEAEIAKLLGGTGAAGLPAAKSA
jgi:transposase-like protein